MLRRFAAQLLASMTARVRHAQRVDADMLVLAWVSEDFFSGSGGRRAGRRRSGEEAKYALYVLRAGCEARPLAAGRSMRCG
jgi:hypothetical protein